MPRFLPAPSIIEAVGTKPKRIEEYVGRVNTGHEHLSLARMISPSGWEEPGQRPEFEEITLVLRGSLHVEHDDGVMRVGPNQAIITHAHEWVRYSTPDPEGAEYVTICVPAFSPDTVRRDVI